MIIIPTHVRVIAEKIELELENQLQKVCHKGLI